MKKRQSLGIRQTLWLAVALTVSSTVLAASALYGYQLYRSSRAAESLRIKAIAETYAAQAAPLAATPSVISAFVNQLYWHHDLCFLAVLDTRNHPIAVRGSTVLLDRYLKAADAHASGLSRGTAIMSADKNQPIPEIYLAAVPVHLSGSKQPMGTLVCAARPAATSNMTAQDVWVFFTRLLLVAAAGMVLGFWWLKRNVLIPLSLLTDRSKKPSDAGESFPIHRDDEIGQLARTLADMHLNLDEWRERSARLEIDADRRVAENTRKAAIELQQTRKKIWTDPLTQLGNRRLLEDRFAEIYQQQSDSEQDLSIVMIDVDNFKKLNDTLGHKAGDELLRFIGELLKQCLREQDVAIRYGGDEFTLIFPGVSVKDAKLIAERTILLFSQQAKLLPIDPKPSMSAGIASIWEHRPPTGEGLLQLADQALYAAKKSGKACAHIYAAKRTPLLV